MSGPGGPSASVRCPIDQDSPVRRSTRIIAGVVLLAVGVLSFRPFGGDGECEGAPCESGFVWRIWVAIGIVVLWLAGMVWFIVAMIRARRRGSDESHTDDPTASGRLCFPFGRGIRWPRRTLDPVGSRNAGAQVGARGPRTGRVRRLVEAEGDWPGDGNVSDACTTPRCAAESRHAERGARGIIPRVLRLTKSACLQALLMPEEGLEPPTRGL